ncbi:MAG: alpha/beta hydrolase [Actinomycetota bacterium]|nr:alpha/beta hydrolase [Actinomycetota bacterium]
MTTSSARGTAHEVRVGAATIGYRELGIGAPVVFVHGLLVNGDLWRQVVPGVARAGLRCLTPDWPLGSHSLAVPGVDLTPTGVAALIAGFLDALDLHDVTIVANDTGGALTQILMTQHPERIGRVVLTPSDSFRHFFPPMFAVLPRLAKIPGGTWLLVQSLRLRALHRLPVAFGWLSKRAIPADVMTSYLGPAQRSAAIRDDLRRFLRSVHKRHTLAAAQALPAFTRPVLLAWASEDRVFPLADGRRLADLLPGARLVEIADSYTFVPEDQPEILTGLIVDFVTGSAA